MLRRRQLPLYTKALYRVNAQAVISALITSLAVGFGLSFIYSNLYQKSATELSAYFLMSYSLWGILSGGINKGFSYKKYYMKASEKFYLQHIRSFFIFSYEGISTSLVSSVAAGIYLVLIVDKWGQILLVVAVIISTIIFAFLSGVVLAVINFYVPAVKLIQGLIMRGGIFFTPVIWVPLADNYGKSKLMDLNPVSFPFEWLSHIVFGESYVSTVYPPAAMIVFCIFVIILLQKRSI